MADSITQSAGDVYTNPVGDNVAVVDPNKIVVNGEIIDRLVNQEDLVMYANLTAQIFPRSKLISGGGAGNLITVDIFKGELNFLKPQDKDSLDTDWTETFTNPDVNKKVKNVNEAGVVVSSKIENATDHQGFGITQINVKLDKSYVPQVTINFTDIRGKTLFEQARSNTPYTAFFHLPYPTFFLTLKGYYGKAVRYQLILQNFVSRFDPSSGDYLITCTFKGNHIALLRDINMHEVITAPYMFPNRVDTTDGESDVVTSTRGRQTMVEVYKTYKQLGLIDEDFPEMTLLELVEMVKSMDNDLGKVYGKVNLSMTTDKLEYGQILKKFKDAVVGDGEGSWKSQYLDQSKGPITVTKNIPDPDGGTGKTATIRVYPLKGISSSDEDGTPDQAARKKVVEEAQNALNSVVFKYMKLLNNNPTFKEFGGKYPVQSKFNNMNFDLFDSSLLNTPGGVYADSTKKIDDFRTKTGLDLKPWIFLDGSEDTFLPLWNQQKKLFEEQGEKMTTEISKELNTRVNAALGFKPTIRNVFAILLAGADTFLRLLDDVHTKAMDVSSNNIRLGLASESNDVKQTGKKDSEIVYPWPQYFKIETKADKNNCPKIKSILTYPGAKDVIETTQAKNKIIWPEVDFVEEYTKTAAYKFSMFKFPTSNLGINKQFTPISVKDYPKPVVVAPYGDLVVVDLLFEILERAKRLYITGGLFTRYDFISNPGMPIQNALFELAEYDANNLYLQIKGFPRLQSLFKDFTTSQSLKVALMGADPINWDLYEQGIPIGTQITNELVSKTMFSDSTFEILFAPLPYTVVPQSFTENTSALKLTKTFGLYDLAPSSYGPWVRANYANGDNLEEQPFYQIYDTLQYDVTESNVLKDEITVQYYTDIMYCAIGTLERGKIAQMINRNMSNATMLSSEPTATQFYEEITTLNHNLSHSNYFLTEGPIHATPTEITVQTPNTSLNPNTSIYTNLDDAKTRVTSMLNTPYFANALVEGVTNDRAGVQSPYTNAAYLFLNSLPLPTFREKSLLKKDGNYDYGDYISQMFNQMPAVHNVPESLLLKLGSIWWRYKQTVRSATGTQDPLSNVFNDLGNIGGIPGATGPGFVYDEVNVNTNGVYTYIDPLGVSVNYQTEQVANNIMQVGVYPALIDTIHYIVTGKNSYANAGAGTVQLTDLIGGPGASILDIISNNEIAYQDANGTTVNFYDVFLSSSNIFGPVGIDFNTSVAPDEYFILYPSSGGLLDTDASTYTNTPAFANNSLHNGGCRILWGASNYGYFQHNPAFQAGSNQYFKKIKTDINHQTAWEFNEEGIYSTIDELRAVFNTSQLDAFEQMFLNFSSLNNGTSTTLKEIMAKIMYVEDTWISEADTKLGISNKFSNKLAQGQMLKFYDVMESFLFKKQTYVHKSITNFDAVVDGSTLLQKMRILAGPPYSDQIDNFGLYGTNPIIPPGGMGPFLGNPQELQDIKIFVGEYYSQLDPQYSLLTMEDASNPIYSFFITTREVGQDGIEFNSKNIENFAPLIRLYASYVVNFGSIRASDFINLILNSLETNTLNQADLYTDQLITKLNSLIKQEEKVEEDVELNISDERSEIQADSLKLELYKSFKTLNDRWVAGTDLLAETLFERFLFYDRANRDIGDDLIINIWDILQLDSPFGGGNSKILTQSISSFVSQITNNNKMNLLALPAYINFHGIEGDNVQQQGNAMFGTFQTVDYLKSKPVFLCQYVGEPSSQLDVRTPDNGFSSDGFNLNLPSPNPLISPDCGDPNLSNKVMGFNVDFGIPNQNIFESVTLDQTQYQDTSESFKILQEMADSGGGGTTSMASVSLFNIYANRSYTAKITCMGNVTIQPTQYFQLRYLPMFNGAYQIINVEHNITPNNIETTFDGVRQPIPELPDIEDLVQKINEKLYQQAEEHIKDQNLTDLFLDQHNFSARELNLLPKNNGFLDKFFDAGDDWGNVVDAKFSQAPIFDPEIVHKGIDIAPKSEYIKKSESVPGIEIFPVLNGVVTKVVSGCKPLQKTNECADYGNYIEIKSKNVGIYVDNNGVESSEGEFSQLVGPISNIEINKSLAEIEVGDTQELPTIYYLTRYAFLRENIQVKQGDKISITDIGNRPIGYMGNSGPSEDTHIHLEIKRAVSIKVGANNRFVEHYLDPLNILPAYKPQ